MLELKQPNFDCEGIIPRLTVIMSVYNGLPLICAAIDSVLIQTFTDFEFIIVNDGSTDDTLSLLRDYADRDRRIRIIDQPNTGLTRALIRGVSAARAPLIARMDADDLSMPRRFEHQVALLEARPDLVAVSCDIEYMAPNLSSSVIVANRFDEDTLPLFMAFSNVISGHGQMVFRKSAYLAVEGYDPACQYAQDYDLWCRLLAIGKIGAVPGVYYRFRIGHDSIGTRHAIAQRGFAARTAMRQYTLMAGKQPDQAVVLNTLKLGGQLPSDDIRIFELLRVQRHLSRAVRAYIYRQGLSTQSVLRMKIRLYEFWMTAFRTAAASNKYRKWVMALLAFRWMPQRILDVGCRKIYKP